MQKRCREKEKKMYTRKENGAYICYQNEGGPKIGTMNDDVIIADGYVFRNLAGTDKLLPYEDWRLPAKERARDLARRLPVESIVGLMMYSPHQMVPGQAAGPFVSTYDGKPFEESGKEPFCLTDQQKKFLEKTGSATSWFCAWRT